MNFSPVMLILRYCHKGTFFVDVMTNVIDLFRNYWKKSDRDIIGHPSIFSLELIKYIMDCILLCRPKMELQPS